MNKVDMAKQAADIIQKQHPNFHPKLGIILGSGMGSVGHAITSIATWDYKDLPGFPIPKVKGHSGQLILGTLEGVNVVCMQGRSHFYESESYLSIKTYVRTLKQLGCEILFITNAAGSLHPDIGPRSLALITDHINFQPGNPLIGENDDEYGTRFPSLNNAYDSNLIQKLLTCAQSLKINLSTGVYACVSGPSYETVAEIRAYRTLGADIVGMSTAPEVIVARHCDMKVVAVSIITNLATGLAKTHHDHNLVVSKAEEASKNLSLLLSSFVKEIKNKCYPLKN